MSIINDQSLSLVEQFLLLLSQKERYVIERRYNLDNKERATLEEIGQSFGVTRERVRQIEKNALNKLRRNLENFALKDIADMAFSILNENGGLIKEDLILAKLINSFSTYKTEALQLILAVDKRFERVPNTVFFHPYIRQLKFTDASMQSFSKAIFTILKKGKEVMNMNSLLAAYVDNTKRQDLDVVALKSYLGIDKKMKMIDADSVGLIEWRHINPRTLRDKIFYVLRKDKKPMHFVDIANKIISEIFDKKKVNLQAVHNELIRFDQFVLVGRGIYGLKEWGFVPGTVADVIESLLKKKESMTQEDIILEVLKQRQVKPITIVLSLKNKNQFVRVGRKQYSLKVKTA